MLNRVKGHQELERVNMFIRALSDEMAQAQSAGNTFPQTVAVEMQEALYELRLRKLVISALVGSDSIADKTIRH